MLQAWRLDHEIVSSADEQEHISGRAGKTDVPLWLSLFTIDQIGGLVVYQVERESSSSLTKATCFRSLVV